MNKNITKEQLTEENIEKKIEKHEQWLKDNNKGERADFSNKVINNFDFTAKDLRCSIWENAEIKMSFFLDANLENSNFSNAYLDKTCCFINTNFNKSNFAKTTIEGISFQKSSFDEADLREIQFGYDINETLKGAKVDKANLCIVDEYLFYRGKFDDDTIVVNMLKKGLSNKELVTTIAEYSPSPEAGIRSDVRRIYAQKIIRKAKKELKQDYQSKTQGQSL